MIKATAIHKSYGNHAILRGIDLAVEKGEFVSIMGKSGSGKSTLLNVLAGNLKPDAGSVLLDGTDIVRLNEKELAKLRRSKLGFVYQSLNLIPTLNGKDNILLPLYLDRQNITKGKENMMKLAGYLGIDDLLNRFPDEMSGGERQRVAIARALIHDPAVLMLDEPTGSLDNRSTKEVMELLCKLNRELGITILQVTHSEAAAACGSRIIRLSDGEVLHA